MIVCVCVWLGLCFALLTHPSVDRPTKADAIVVLGQPDPTAVALAERLITQGISSELLLSVPFGNVPACYKAPPGVHVECLVPDPKTTQGDAELIRTVAIQRHWNNIVVITWTAHIARSRLLVNRCFSGHVQMVDYDATFGIAQWLREYVHQTGGYIKAMFDRSC